MLGHEDKTSTMMRALDRCNCVQWGSPEVKCLLLTAHTHLPGAVWIRVTSSLPPSLPLTLSSPPLLSLCGCLSLTYPSRGSVQVGGLGGASSAVRTQCNYLGVWPY